MRIHPIVFAIVVLTIFLGTILGFQAAGVWTTSGKVTASGEKVQPIAGDVNSLKGWMTMEQVTAAFNVPLEEMVTHFNLPAGTTPQTALKDLESDTFDVTALRDWLTERQAAAAGEQPAAAEGQPGEQPAAQPTAAPTATPAPTQPAADAAPTATLHAPADRSVTGKTTFQQVLDWGVSKETIEQIIGGPMPLPGTLIKDYVTGKGLEFPGIKAAMQAAMDQAGQK